MVRLTHTQMDSISEYLDGGVKITFEKNSQGSLVSTIETLRLKALSLEETDAASLAALMSDEHVVAKYADGKPWDAAKLADWVKVWTGRWKNGDPYSAFKVMHKGTGEFMGIAALAHGRGPGEGEGIAILHTKYWKQGFGGELRQGFLDFAYATLFEGFTMEGKPLEQIIATAKPDNFASVALMKIATFLGVIERHGAERYAYMLHISPKDVELVEAQAPSAA